MTSRNPWVKRVGVAVVALGFVAGTTVAPATAGPAKDKTVDCIDYGAVPRAPKGAIPRDDLQVVKQDPLKIAAAKAASTTVSASAAPTSPVTVPVRFHEIVKATGNGGGDLSSARVAAQIEALNVGFAGTGFTFVLDFNDETVQPEWFNLIGANGAEPRYFRGGGKEVRMKQLLADDDPKTLEVYSASLGQSLLGWAYFPSDFTDETSSEYGPLHRYLDGVVIDFRSVPAAPGSGGDARVFPPGTYEQGDTLTHEVGHWLELYHTFQGGCPENPSYRGGDQIEDTPPEASPNFFCPEPGDPARDTCLGDDKPDPINNFMDYSFDSCLTEFTGDQAARMQLAWETYRN